MSFLGERGLLVRDCTDGEEKMITCVAAPPTEN